MAELKGKAFKTIANKRPKYTYRGAVVGCGRMGSTIDDEHIGMPHYPWPWAHAPAMIEAHGIDLVAAADSIRKNWTISNSDGKLGHSTRTIARWLKKRNQMLWLSPLGQNLVQRSLLN